MIVDPDPEAPPRPLLAPRERDGKRDAPPAPEPAWAGGSESGSESRSGRGSLSPRMLLAGPLVAAVSLLCAFVALDAAGIPLRDPDHVAGRRLAMLVGLVAALIALDVVVRAARRASTLRPPRDVIAAVRRERWTRGRLIAVVSALVSFYVTYLAYRNLKSIVPLLRPGELYDRQLAEIDRGMFGGADPAVLLHDLMGTGLATHAMSAAYMLFFAFIPVTLAIALVFSRDLRTGLFYTTAQSINWLIGAGSYFLLPSLGPIYADPGLFSSFPATAITDLQDLLIEQRTAFVRDPVGGTAQSIAAFASVHVSVFFTGALAAHLLGLRRSVRIAAWAMLGLTVLSTIHLGWHYVLDDVAGLILGALALAVAAPLTGFDLRGARRRAAVAPVTAPAPAGTAAGAGGRLRPAPVRWRAVAAGPAVAAVTLVLALLATGTVGLPVRDPDHVAALYLGLVGFGVVLLVGLDIVLRARADSGSFPPSRAALRRVRRERWTPRRALGAGAALVGFYVTYMAYRNLKSVVPLVRPGELFDRELADLDRGMFIGNDPAALMHALPGADVLTHVLSTAYVAFIVFLPLTIGLTLVFSRDLRAGLFYTTAQSINWLLGAASYFLLPSLGPIYFDPAAFADLPYSEVTRLQGILLDQRNAFLIDPASATPQSIAGFASLHISMSFTALVAAHLLGLGRRLKIALWAWFVLTTAATIHLGWHYVLDDIGGVILGAMALVLAALVTGIDPRTMRERRVRAPLATP